MRSYQSCKPCFQLNSCKMQWEIIVLNWPTQHHSKDSCRIQQSVFDPHWSGNNFHHQVPDYCTDPAIWADLDPCKLFTILKSSSDIIKPMWSLSSNSNLQLITAIKNTIWTKSSIYCLWPESLNPFVWAQHHTWTTLQLEFGARLAQQKAICFLLWLVGSQKKQVDGIQNHPSSSIRRIKAHYASS